MPHNDRGVPSSPVLGCALVLQFLMTKLKQLLVACVFTMDDGEILWPIGESQGNCSQKAFRYSSLQRNTDSSLKFTQVYLVQNKTMGSVQATAQMKMLMEAANCHCPSEAIACKNTNKNASSPMHQPQNWMAKMIVSDLKIG